MAKNFLQVILKQLTEKPKWTFWPTRYLQHKFSAGGYLPHSPTTTSEDSWRCLDSLLSWLNGEYYWNPVGRDHEWCEASHLTKDSSQPTNNYVPQNISTVRLRNSDVEGPSKALRSVGNWLKKKKDRLYPISSTHALVVSVILTTKDFDKVKFILGFAPQVKIIFPHPHFKINSSSSKQNKNLFSSLKFKRDISVLEGLKSFILV